jgi:hypothetical protein
MRRGGIKRKRERRAQQTFATVAADDDATRTRAPTKTPTKRRRRRTHGGAISTLARRLCLVAGDAFVITLAPRRAGENCTEVLRGADCAVRKEEKGEGGGRES